VGTPEISAPDSPAADVLADEVEETTVDAARVTALGGPGAEDFVWDEEDSQAMRQARKDAELTVAADSVRSYLTQIGRIALLTAEQEVTLAKRVEAGLYAAERIRWAKDSTKNSPRSCAGICAGSSATASVPRPTYWKRTCAWSSR
jgi:RNA polymerase primary sigma factor